MLPHILVNLADILAWISAHQMKPNPSQPELLLYLGDSILHQYHMMFLYNFIFFFSSHLAHLTHL